ncbi:hypothetical protein B566_EDAN010541 [Ephemera danica]|nr:hypothetical protein B566_EDAN010541 [Ephemera danica]
MIAGVETRVELTGEQVVQTAPVQGPPALPPRPPPRPRLLPGVQVQPGDCLSCPLQVDIAGAASSPPTPAHYEPPPDHQPASSSSALQQHHEQHQISHQEVTGVTATSATGVDVRGHPRCWSAALRKYVILCTACGGMAALLGALFLLVHFVLRAHTSSLHYFETVPTYIPAAMLTVTGLVVMCFARRKNRYGYLIKVCGVFCLLCAVLCVVVTVTTTVIHMNRLQLLRRCVYDEIAQACTCYSGLPPPDKPSQESLPSDEDLRFVFHNTTDCGVVHGALYACLRALFGLSVIGILVCIFSCMLVYQLLSHEKKKMYWEQLEMRCRYLYGRGRAPQYALCGCSCEECPRFPPPNAATAATPHADIFPWPGGGWEQQGGYLDDRYWSPRIGNLYTPSPDEAAPNTQSNAATAAPSNARWSWLPWHRNACRGNVENVAEVPVETRERPLSRDPDSQYGFGATVRQGAVQLAPRTVGSQVVPICRPLASHAFVTETSAGLPRYMWGPPPPYSQPPSSSSNSSSTSPSRHPDPMQMHTCYTRHPTHMSPAHHHHHHHHLVHCSGEGSSHPGSPQHQAIPSPTTTPAHMPHSPPAAARRSVTNSPCCARIRADDTLKLELQAPCGNNTLPSRKPKKRPSENSPCALKSSPQPQVEGPLDSPGRKQGAGLASSLRGLFGNVPATSQLHNASPPRTLLPQSAPTSATSSPHKVYFADVSSCNGGPDSSLYDEPNAPELPAERYLPRAARYGGNERLAPDAQYEPPRVSAAPPQVAEDDAPMRDSDATIDSGVHSGSELATAASSGRVARAPALTRAEVVEQQQASTRSVNIPENFAI